MELFLRFAAGGWIPARWYVRGLPEQRHRAARQGRLKIEIVSHCWSYAHLLIYQLSSLVRHPPARADVIMTVFHAREDAATRRLLAYFAGLEVPSVRWNPRVLPREQLFRRAIGRNLAALETGADWIWFTDCDLLFGAGCLDGLSDALQGRTEALVFPRFESCTGLLADDAPILRAGRTEPQVLPVDTSLFRPHERTRATGPLQITHGDVVRACGYCRDLPYYQQPSPKWCKAHEDRAFRWLLGSQGHPLDIPGVYRIRHVHKGRYTGSRMQTAVRSRLRQLSLKLKERS